MTTYNTYAEAKIANPNFDVCNYVTGGFGIPEPGGVDYFTCSPADHCSTLAEFLGAGYKLADGDFVLGFNGDVCECGDGATVEDWSRPSGSLDYERFILSAAALNGGSKISEQKESTVTDIDWSNEVKPDGAQTFNNTPRDGLCFFKVSQYGPQFCYKKDAKDSYWQRCANGFPDDVKPIPTLREKFVKVTQENTSPEQLAQMVLDGDTFTDGEHNGGRYEYRDVYARYARQSDSLYRKTLTPVDLKQEWVNAAIAAADLQDNPLNREKVGRIHDANLAKDIE